MSISETSLAGACFFFRSKCTDQWLTEPDPAEIYSASMEQQGGFWYRNKSFFRLNIYCHTAMTHAIIIVWRWNAKGNFTLRLNYSD